jgi:putative thiamine transport system permease protein
MWPSFRARESPTLAVLAWQWLNQGDSEQQIKGTLLCLLLLLLLAILAAAGLCIWKMWRRTLPDVSGVRHSSHHAVPVKTLGWLVPGCGLFCTLVLILLARGSDTAFTLTPPVSLSAWLPACWR